VTYLGSDVAAVSGPVARLALLAQFDFVDDPRWYWTGFGSLRTLDDHLWEGTAGLAAISGLDVPIGTTAPQVTFTLSGVDPRIIALARRQSDTVKGRAVTVWFQLFNDDWSLRGAPYHIWTGDLDVMTYNAGGDGTYTVSVSAESIWAGRRKPAFGYLSDADQEARSPGDRGLEQVASLPGKTINWPI
jgi:hypothetical protein